MSDFDYPLNTRELYRKKRKIHRELSDRSGLLHKKIAVLGGSTTNEVVDQLDNFLLHHGISAEFYQSEYGKYWEDATFGNEILDSFSPEIIYIHTNWRNIDIFPKISDSKEVVDSKLEQVFSHYENMWKSIEGKFHCPVIQNNFDRPNYRLMGNRDIWDYRGRSNFISRLNQKFYTYAQNHDNFYINDLEYLSADYGLAEWSSPKYWYLYKSAMCMDAIPYVAKSVADIIKAIYGKNKKVLSLDLDNTLWGGVIGDDGPEGIKIGRDTSSGQAYTEFQEYCKNLKDIGVVLTVNSKNDPDNALSGLTHPDSLLRPDDFVSIKANWEPKNENLAQTADELDLGTDSFVFVDDNPAERELIRKQMPEVAVPEVNTVDDYIRVLDHSGYFEPVSITGEDIRKTDLYRAKAEASQAKRTFSDYGKYLDSLQMVAEIAEFRSVYIPRIAQLTNKSNQFNLTTMRCSDDDIRTMQNSKDYICLYGRLSDKFGDNGLVTVVIGKVNGDELDIILWLMSCRVLKRGMEDAMMNVLISKAKEMGIVRVYGHYYPTVKNSIVKDFYGDYGYKKLKEDASGNTEWVIDTEDYKDKILHMKVK